jgi:hypothetical protein
MHFRAGPNQDNVGSAIGIRQYIGAFGNLNLRLQLRLPPGQAASGD